MLKNIGCFMERISCYPPSRIFFASQRGKSFLEFRNFQKQPVLDRVLPPINIFFAFFSNYRQKIIGNKKTGPENILCLWLVMYFFLLGTQYLLLS